MQEGSVGRLPREAARPQPIAANTPRGCPPHPQPRFYTLVGERGAARGCAGGRGLASAARPAALTVTIPSVPLG